MSSINLLQETPIPLNHACRVEIQEYTGKSISPQTGHRWRNPGVLAADGQRVCLGAIKVGRQYFTTDLAIKRFFDELSKRSNASSDGDEVAANAQTTAELRAVGLMTRKAETKANKAVRHR